MTTIFPAVRLTAIDYGMCGGTYAINERYRQEKYEKSGNWHCPYCQCSWGSPYCQCSWGCPYCQCSWGYNGPTQAEPRDSGGA